MKGGTWVFFTYTTEVLFKGAVNKDENKFFMYQNLLQCLCDSIIKLASRQLERLMFRQKQGSQSPILLCLTGRPLAELEDHTQSQVPVTYPTVPITLALLLIHLIGGV